MSEVKLTRGWFRRDVDLAVVQVKCTQLIHGPLALTKDEMAEWYREGLAIKARRTIRSTPEMLTPKSSDAD